ncbi:hypothetical protein AGMMS4957_14150 [Bacteroidia bacterium]|nr:hypothetical protein AGMMS4957_14150 [Bacteroidia bacterium]
MDEISRYIAELLAQHEAVTVPHFGTLTVVPLEGKVTHLDGMLHPPTNSLHFDHTLTDSDGLLAVYIGGIEEITYRMAEERLLLFVAELREILKKEKRVRLPSIGEFTLSHDKEITFTPAPTEELSCNADNYGLDKFYMPKLDESVIREHTIKRETPTTQTSHDDEGKHSHKSSAETTDDDDYEDEDEDEDSEQSPKKKKKRRRSKLPLLAFMMLLLLIAVIFCLPLMLAPDTGVLLFWEDVLQTLLPLVLSMSPEEAAELIEKLIKPIMDLTHSITGAPTDSIAGTLTDSIAGAPTDSIAGALTDSIKGASADSITGTLTDSIKGSPTDSITAPAVAK